MSRLLDIAMELPAHSRREWLASRRDLDPAVVEEIEAWLGEFDAMQSTGFLEERLDVVPPETPGAGMAVGSYRLREPIGQGGMGTVWLAERSDGQFEQRAAVKLLHPVLRGSKATERFAREAGILARLTHPQIAHLLDAGITEAGTPYLVLEHVDGEHIDRHCDRRRMSVRARVRLFLDVLTPVAHAHANLVVHRDLKLSNVLVTSGGHVKLLDFGIAKLLPAEVSPGHPTVVTYDGALTPACAAPEQLTGGDVTTRTDVYALGVLLYQLLTGRHPSVEAAHTPAGLITAIVERPPRRASDAVMGAAVSPDLTRESVAALRGTTAERLRQTLSGDLDTILATALEKDPGRRYATVTALYDDLNRFLREEPIAARPDGFAYRATKFVRRHRLPVALAAAASLALAAGLVGTIVEARRATSQAHRADEAATAAIAQRDFARRQLVRAEAINDLNAFLIADAAPLGATFTARDLLTRAEQIVSRQADDQLGVRAEMLVSLGRLYGVLGETANSLRVLDQAYQSSRPLGDRAVRAQASCGLATAVVKAGDPTRAERLVSEGLDELPDAPEYAAARMQCHQNAAIVLTWSGRNAEAVDEVRAARDVAARAGALTPLAELKIGMDLAEALRNAGRLQEANTAFAEVHERLVALGREDTERAGTLLNNWALVLNSLGRPRDAERLFRRSVEISAEGSRAARVDPILWNNLAQCLFDLGRTREALALSTRAYEEARNAGDVVVADQALLTRARLLVAVGDLGQGDRMLQEAESKFTKMFPPSHAAFVAVNLDRAGLAERRGDLGRASAYVERALSMVEANPARQGYLPQVLRRRASIEVRLGRFEDAQRDAGRAVAIAQERAGAGSRSGSVGLALIVRAEAGAAAGHLADARSDLTEAIEHLDATVDADHPDLRRARRMLARLASQPIMRP